MRQGLARLGAAGALVLVALGSSSDAHAQAWVGDTGALDLNLDYNFGTSDKVVAEPADFPDAGSQTHTITVGAEYTPIARLAVSAALPIVAIKYTGDQVMYPHPAGGSYDDGDLHTTPTDLRAGARYQLLDDPVALAPHLAFSIPVADYETIGNAVAGRGLKALHAGLGLGYIIGDATYIHLLYEFSLVEKYDETPETEQHSQNRSDVAFTIGHKLLQQRLDLHIDANLRETHGGVAFEEFPTLTPNELMFHDAILDEDMILVGAGVGYQISNSLSLNAAARFFVSGVNTQNATVFAIGLGWSPL